MDSLMGTGKTSWALQHMNEYQKERFMFVTPFLDEVDRIISGTAGRLKAPGGEGTKFEDLKKKLVAGDSIVCTHQLFRKISEEEIKLIQEQGYILILDEVLDAVQVYPGLAAHDLLLLQESNHLEIDDTGRLIWNEDKAGYQTRYADLQYYARNRLAFSTDDSNVLIIFNPNIFKAFVNVYILTYMFEGSIMEPYFKLSQIDFMTKRICKAGTDYQLEPGEAVGVEEYAPLINLIRDKINCRSEYMKPTSFSVSWLQRLNKEMEKRIKNDLKNYFQNKVHAPAATILYTTTKEAQPKIEGRGYKSCFLPWNIRAVNSYADRYNLAYCFNCYLNPAIKSYFTSYRIYVNEEAYAVANMLQWIWRSRIRNKEPINIFIPSIRMRELLQQWMRYGSVGI